MARGGPALKAQVLTRFGDVTGFELREWPVPELRAGHVLVEVAASGVNPVDCKVRRHGSGAAPELPAVLGADFCGTVVAVADDVTRFAPGDEVYGCGGGLRGMPGGTLAEYLVVDARLAAHRPRSLTRRQCAALPMVALTALEGLDRAGLAAGQHVLVRGGTGGVGHVVIQLAKARGARVTATVSSPERAALARSFGADGVADHSRETPAAMASEHAAGHGFDVVFDASGGNDLPGSVEATRRNGHIVAIAGKGAHDVAAMYARGHSLHFVLALIPMLSGEGREAHGAMLERIGGLADAGRLRPLLDGRTYSLEDTPEAHRRLEEHHALGKVVVDVAVR